ncbi:hypothetical protein ILUMI_02370 [Ignelater luminosus]|uniref:Uncharacterized protein n=1 Tax=Ignelater luminosus TaxID=2038154 RepID=A0A8K0DCV6_IGNLU|nr:hypothetical protein ILUMI_02370 [Ignelater luminosus]
MVAFGGFRRDDIVKMTIDDVEDKGSVLLIKVPETKTVTSKGFTIVEKDQKGALSLVRQCIALRPKGIREERLYYLHHYSSTLFIEAGAFFEILRLHGKWNGSTVVESYTEESISSKTELLKEHLSVNVGLRRNEDSECNTLRSLTSVEL